MRRRKKSKHCEVNDTKKKSNNFFPFDDSLIGLVLIELQQLDELILIIKFTIRFNFLNRVTLILIVSKKITCEGVNRLILR